MLSCGNARSHRGEAGGPADLGSDALQYAEARGVRRFASKTEPGEALDGAAARGLKEEAGLPGSDLAADRAVFKRIVTGGLKQLGK